MNTSLTADQISMMNSILDKELDNFKEDVSLENSRHSSSIKLNGIQNKETTPTLDSSFTNTNTNSRSSNTDSLQRPPKDSHYKAPSGLNRTVDVNESSNKSLRMQEELLDLQNKIIEMEKMVNQMGSPIRSVASPTSILKKPSIRETLHSEIEPPQSAKRQHEELIPPKISHERKFSSNKGSTDRQKISKRSDSDSSDSDSEHESARRRSRGRGKKTSSYTPGRQFENLKLKEEIESEGIKLEHDKERLRRTSSGRLSAGRNSRKESPSSARRHSYRGPSGEKFQTNEIYILNKRVTSLNRRVEEERNERTKESLKNQELSQYNQTLQKTVKKLQIELDKYQKLDSDYQKLLTSFEKSEYIRNQQKILISNLQMEIEQLKNSENQDENIPGQKREKKTRKKSQKNRSPAMKKKIF